MIFLLSLCVIVDIILGLFGQNFTNKWSRVTCKNCLKDGQRFEVKENSIVDQRGWVAIHKGTGKVVLQSWNKEVLLGFLFSYGREAKKEGRKVTIDIYRRDGWFDHLWINTDSKEKKHVSV